MRFRQPHLARRYRPNPRNRKGFALLVCLFVMMAVACLLVNVVDQQTSQMAAARNSLAYEQARYLAEAGINHALAMIEAEPSWTGTIAATEFPSGSGNTYTATATSVDGSTTAIVASGSAGGFTRKVTCTVSLE